MESLLTFLFCVHVKSALKVQRDILGIHPVIDLWSYFFLWLWDGEYLPLCHLYCLIKVSVEISPPFCACESIFNFILHVFYAAGSNIADVILSCPCPCRALPMLHVLMF